MLDNFKKRCRACAHDSDTSTEVFVQCYEDLLELLTFAVNYLCVHMSCQVITDFVLGMSFHNKS